MVWKEYSRRLSDVLGLKGFPISVTYSMNPVPDGKEGKHWVCQALLDVRNGAIINLSKETCACPGGISHLGLGPPPSGNADKALKKFLIEGEKLFCSLAVFHRSSYLTAPPPLGLAEYVILSPLEKAELKPNIVVFLCNPEQACRLVTLAHYPVGIPPRVEIVGSTCHMVITYPLASGQLNISLLDYTSRKMQKYASDEMFVSIPYHLMSAVMESIDLCTAGTAKTEVPPEFVELMGKQAKELIQ